MTAEATATGHEHCHPAGHGTHHDLQQGGAIAYRHKDNADRWFAPSGRRR
jgi:hypothetical protein